ncbi:cellulose binding domain-containing protein [Acetivibrio straminisolvens]|uniref:Endoglucanase Z n=1 Tax=Acetivibrio straminisolvens JCM 21531 TaxID=1294263 RepID=W4V8M0_9FIRM|nr:cellulose binding domain-containing protein [Acetivibrio straminisolvens]GAE89178.1 endoglucanase Z precursor [Acetivibrio straminisolvens JCM 21531]
MRKQRRISIMVAVFFIIQCLSLATFASNSFASTASVSVEMYNSNTQTYSNTISPNFKIYNTGSTSINLSTIKVRYYYTSDGITGQTYICDYAENQSNIASSTVGQIVSMTNQTSDADTYLEIYFTSSAGVVLPGSYVEVKGRIVSYNYQNYTQSNDYSFNPTATYYQSSNKVTIYVNGVLKGGTEPYPMRGKVNFLSGMRRKKALLPLALW